VHPRAVAHDDTPRSLRGEGLIAHTTVASARIVLPLDKIIVSRLDLFRSARLCRRGVCVSSFPDPGVPTW